jgi:hypothetical protein
VPRKYVITSKEVTGAPQYTMQISDWQSDVPIADSNFAFTPPAGAKKVAASEMKQLNEVPQGAVIAARNES